MNLPGFLANLFKKFFRDETTTLAASLAFFTALSLAPILILFVAISSLLSQHLQGDFIDQARSLMGREAARSLEAIIRRANSRADLTSMAGLFGVGTLLVSAGLIFGQLKLALNRIFGVQAQAGGHFTLLHQILRFLRERLFQVGMALIFILSLIISLLVSSVLSSTLILHDKTVAIVLNIGLSFGFYLMLFSLVFHFLPDRRQPWKYAFVGGTLASVLFVIGKEFLAIYLGKSALGSAYGAAGSVIVLLVWVYYSTLITFVGAQVSSLLNRERT